MLKKEGPCAPVGKSLFGGVDVGDDGLNHLRVAGVCLHLALYLVDGVDDGGVIPAAEDLAVVV